MIDERSVPLTLEDIDFSSVQPPAPAPAPWRAPKRVFYGKRLPDGSSEEEPIYQHIEYPRMLYALLDGKPRTKVVHSDEERDAALAEGWVKNPIEIGIVTCPSFEEAQRIRIAREGVEPAVLTETVEIVKRGPGRPRKAA